MYPLKELKQMNTARQQDWNRQTRYHDQLLKDGAGKAILRAVVYGV